MEESAVLCFSFGRKLMCFIFSHKDLYFVSGDNVFSAVFMILYHCFSLIIICEMSNDTYTAHSWFIARVLCLNL